jgi:predicted phage tail component-like protein
VAIKLDDRPLSDFGIALMSPATHPMAPQTEDITLQVPGRDGLYYFGSKFGERRFSFPCGMVWELNEVDLQRRLREFTAFLLDTKGKPREMRLTFDYEPEKYYLVKYSGQLSPERFYSLGTFALPLTAFDPYAYAEATVYSNNPSKVAWNANGMAVTLTNHSPIEVPIQIKIRGAVLNPKITNLNTYKSMQVNEQFTTTLGDLIIDSHNFTVQRLKKVEEKYFLTGSFPAKMSEVTTKNNLLSKYVGDFILLTPGENTLYFEGTNINTNIYFEWKHRFL